MTTSAEAAPSVPQRGRSDLGDGSALSLASYRRNAGSVTVPDGVVWSGCERRITEVRDAGSEAIYWAGCGAWLCPVCGPRKARKYAEAVAEGNPTTFGRLSLMPETFDLTRKQMFDLRRRLTDKYGTVEWAWVRHRNPALTGFHVHFVGRMPWIPQRELQAMTGGRIPWIAATKQSLGTADYLLGVRARHGASGYLLKRSAAPEFYLDHLELNGGRGVHWSRGYFEGRSVSDVLHALKRSRSRSSWYRPGSPQSVDWSKGSPVSVPDRVIDIPAEGVQAPQQQRLEVI